MSVIEQLAHQPSAKRVLKRIRELEPYAVIEKPDASGVPASWIFIHRQHWADELVVSIRTISRSLEILEGLGLIERQQAFQSRGYGREVHVRLTADGRDAAEQLVSSKLPSRQVKAGTIAAGWCNHGTIKLPPRQHINRLERQGETELQEEKEILLHSPNGDCRFEEEGKFQGRPEPGTNSEERTVEAQLETLFRRCFNAAFPDARVQVATAKSLELIASLASEVRAGQWNISEIDETWSRIFPMWWRFVTDVPVRTYDRQRPDRFCAVTYLSEMYNYLSDHARILDEEAALGRLAPSNLRRAVLSAYDEMGGVRNLVARDPDDASFQLHAMADYLRDHGVTSGEGIRFVARLACYLGHAGQEGSKYWTPRYQDIGFSVPACLDQAQQARNEPAVKNWAGACVREFAARVSEQLSSASHVDELFQAEMDAAIRVATCINLGNGKGDPVKLFKEAFGVGVQALAK